MRRMPRAGRAPEFIVMAGGTDGRAARFAGHQGAFTDEAAGASFLGQILREAHRAVRGQTSHEISVN